MEGMVGLRGHRGNVEFAREMAIGTSFTEYTAHTEQRPSAFGDGMVTTEKETKLEEEHDFAAGEFAKFQPGECVICRQGKGYVHGRVQMLQQ